VKRAFDDRPGLDVTAWYGSPWQPDPDPPPPTPPDHLHRAGPRAAAAPKDAQALSRVGIVLGRFLPVHVGHVHLVEQAFAQCGLLYVITPPRYEKGGIHTGMLSAAFGELATIRTAYPRTTNAPIDDASSVAAAWAGPIKDLVPNATTLFSSDDGGGAGALSQALGIEHILVDPKRKMFQISATQIRDDLYGRFRWIAPAVRPYLTLNVAIVGPEGAGKTTLARELATLFEATVVEDSLRMEAERTGAIPSAEAFERSLLSARAEREAAARACTSGVVISDDAAILTQGWAMRLGIEVTVKAAREAQIENADLWLYCHNDFPFQGPPDRDDLVGRWRIEKHLDGELGKVERKNRVIHVRGEGQDRVDVAADAIRAALEEKRAKLVGLLS
jgi:HTH-type transcriptional repressor of NAD biosynthesis genes